MHRCKQIDGFSFPHTCKSFYGIGHQYFSCGLVLIVSVGETVVLDIYIFIRSQILTFPFSVVKAEIVGPGAATTNTYVTLKLQSVKSTTVPVKGRKPTWNQDFLLWVNKILFPSNSETLLLANCFSEVSDLDTGLLLEVWEKGMLWDKAIGYYWCPLNTIPFSKQVIK